jgi:hypothetical protein
MAEVEKILIGLGFVLKTSQDKLQSFPEDGECELSWLKTLQKPDLILLSLPIIWILKVFNG